MPDELLEVLEHGLAGPFWAWFVAQVHQEWGPTGARYQAEMDRALAIVDDNACAAHARQVRSGQKAILALLRLPEETCHRLRHPPGSPGAAPPRDGRLPLAAALADQGRRGDA